MEPKSVKELSIFIEKRLEATLSTSVLDGVNLTAFAQATAVYVATFQHVLNPKLPESLQFKSFIKNHPRPEMIGYIRDGRRIPKQKIPTLKDFKEAYRRMKSETATDRDRLDYFLCRISARLFQRKRGRSPNAVFVGTVKGRRDSTDQLQRYCLNRLATAYKAHTKKEVHAGSNSYFLNYLDLCARATGAKNLTNARELVKKHILQVIDE